ncbi:MAG TPA: 2-oxoacid:acceptor oxidoreductase family protein [bacterium]|nr:2-oxoacid:acceptor oxidoreductase family protein [bacterium]
MYRIRFHGRGGQGVKTASRILGSAFFAEGYEVQDAPRYGAERRGAPIFAYVRAQLSAIHERGVIARPDLVVVIDETLLPLPAAGVLAGVTEHTVLLLNAARLPELPEGPRPGQIVLMPELGEVAARGGLPLVAAACAGAAARLTGVVSGASVRQAVADELSALGAEILEHNLELALSAYHRMDDHTGTVQEGEAPAPSRLAPPNWIALPQVDVQHAVAAIFHGATSARVHTGLWRTERPVINPAACKHCWWVCTTFCPDGVIGVTAEGVPEIDYDHCKGCLVCLAQCPSHAIEAVLEREAGAVAAAASAQGAS